MNVNRRSFLKGAMATGAILTMPSFLEGCFSTRPRLAGSVDPDPLENAIANGFKEPILKAINCGITAPNPHNTQSWKFRLLGETEALLFADENRLLPATDPPARQIHIGCGTFLEHLSLGAREMDLTAKIEYFPEGEYGLSQIGRKPVARIQLQSQTKSLKKDPLFKQIPERLTDRMLYDGPMISDGEFQTLKELVGESHSEIKIVNQPDRIRNLNRIFKEAMAIEVLTHETYEESRLWFRYNDREIYEKRDGISWRTSGMGSLKRILAETFVGRSEEEWHKDSNKRMYLGLWDETVESSRAFVYFESKTNKQSDWPKTGRDYARFQLAVTALGLRMHPMSQVLQEYPEMLPLQKEFNQELGILGRVQMVVRLGRGKQDFKAPRRPVSEMIIS